MRFRRLMPSHFLIGFDCPKSGDSRAVLDRYVYFEMGVTHPGGDSPGGRQTYSE